MPRCNPSLLKMEEPFRALFTTSDTVRKAVLKDMKTRGYDPAFPIIVWNRVVIDGHTRVSVAKQLGIDVDYVEKNFNSLSGALHYALHCQKDRRNISPEALLRAVELVDAEEKSLAKGRQKELAGTRPQTFGPEEPKVGKGDSAEKTGEALGISSTQVKRIRAINDPQTPSEIKEKVKQGELSITKGAEMARQARKPKQPEEKEETTSEATPQITRATRTREKDPKFLSQIVRAVERGERYFGSRGAFLYPDELNQLNGMDRRLRGLYVQAEETLKSMMWKLKKENQ